MNRRLRYLSLAEAAEGMVLGAQVVVPEHGIVRFSLPAGHTLTEGNLRQLAVHGAEFICVQEEDVRSDEVLAAEIAAHERRLAQIFRAADLGQPAMAGLFRAVLAYRRS